MTERSDERVSPASAFLAGIFLTSLFFIGFTDKSEIFVDSNAKRLAGAVFYADVVSSDKFMIVREDTPAISKTIYKVILYSFRT